MIIELLLVFLIVPIVLNVMSAKTTTTSTEQFDMLLPKKEFLFIGTIGCLFFGACIYGTISSGQSSLGTNTIFGILFLLSMLIIIAPVKGFWGNSVNGDELTSTRLWRIKKSIKISDIDHCVMTRNGIKVYIKDQKKAAIGIDSMATNISNFLSRMKQENIPVEIKDALNPKMLEQVNTSQDTNANAQNTNNQESVNTDNNQQNGKN